MEIHDPDMKWTNENALSRAQAAGTFAEQS